MSDLKRSLEAAIETRQAGARLAAEQAHEVAKQARLQQEDLTRAIEQRRPIRTELVARVRSDLWELAILLNARDVPQELTIGVYDTGHAVHYTGLLAAMRIGRREIWDVPVRVGTRKLWKLEELIIHGGGTGWDGTPAPYTEHIGKALGDNGELFGWSSEAYEKSAWEIDDETLIPLGDVDLHVPARNNQLVAEWQSKIVNWGARLIVP